MATEIRRGSAIATRLLVAVLVGHVQDPSGESLHQPELQDVGLSED